MAMINNDWMS